MTETIKSFEHIDFHITRVTDHKTGEVVYRTRDRKDFKTFDEAETYVLKNKDRWRVYVNGLEVKNRG